MQQTNFYTLTSFGRNLFDNNKSLQALLNDIRQYKPLDKAVEAEYIKKYQETGDKKYRDEVVNHNMLFVVSVAKCFTRNVDEVMDLVIEGAMGLVEAVEKFDLTRDAKVIVYAQAYIRRNISAYIYKYKLPIYRSVDLKYGSTITKVREKFFTENQREPEFDELKEILLDEYDIKISGNHDVYKTSFSSIDDVMDNEHSDSVIKCYEAIINNITDYNDCNDELNVYDFNKEMETKLSYLNDSEKEVISGLLGIGCQKKTMFELSLSMNLCKERIRQIKVSAIEKIQKNCPYSDCSILESVCV